VALSLIIVQMVNIGSTATGAKVIAVKADAARLSLTSPACTEIGEKIALSRRIEKHWRLIGWANIVAYVLLFTNLAVLFLTNTVSGEIPSRLWRIEAVIKALIICQVIVTNYSYDDVMNKARSRTTLQRVSGDWDIAWHCWDSVAALHG
jgi:hypothetical protein